MDRRNQWAATAAVAAFALGVGVATGRWATAQAPAGPTAPPAYQPDDPPNRGLDANLYMQTAAEYRACCLQAYRLAADRLAEGVKGAKGGKTPAVVLDLDETVFDNAGFQAVQLRSGLAYDPRLWERWEEKGADRVGLVPGAKEFLDGATKLGARAVYISNRSDRFKEQAKAALTRLGLPLAGDADLMLATDATGSNKQSRREAAEKEYRVVLYVGDNLRDFDERFRFPDLSRAGGEAVDQAIRDRKAEVDKTVDEWGRRWVILPNPAYGEWPKALGRGKADLDRLAPVVKEK